MQISTQNSKFFSAILGLLLTSTVLMCCSGVSIGAGGSTVAPNDVRPTTVPVAQGMFTSQNGQTITGTASVFNVSSGNYVLRLEGISTTTAISGLQVILYASSGNQTFALRASSGNQNYTFSDANSYIRFSSVSIYSSTTNLSYGSALFK